MQVNSTTCTATDRTKEVEVRRPRRAPSPAGVVGYSSISPSSSSNSKHNLTLAATLPVSYHWKMVSTLDTQTRHTRTPTAHRSGKEPTCGKSPGKQSFFPLFVIIFHHLFIYESFFFFFLLCSLFLYLWPSPSITQSNHKFARLSEKPNTIYVNF